MVRQDMQSGVSGWGKPLAGMVVPESHEYPMHPLHLPDLMNQESALPDH